MAFDIYVICFLFIIGLFAGLINVLIGLKKSVHKKHLNECDYCDAKYKWYELIPVVAYVSMQGECKYCHKKLSIMYSLLELANGVFFSLSYIYYGFSYEMLIMLILICLTTIIYVSDFKYYIIPNGVLLFFGLAILALKGIFFGWETLLISFISGIVIFFFMFLVKLVGNVLFKREALGDGDIKLSMLFGFAFGIRLAIVSLIIGSFLAFPVAIYYSLVGKDKEIPFGPYLVTGLFIVFVFMEPIRHFLEIIFK